MIKQVVKRVVPRPVLDRLRLYRENVTVAKYYAKLTKYRKSYPKNKNEKIRIVFFVQRTEIFNSVRTIVEAADRDERCEVFLLPLPRCKNGEYELLWDTYDSVIHFCKEVGCGTVLEVYDKEKNEFKDLQEVNPDFVFLNVPYTWQYPEPYKIEQLATVGKVCYVPYGYSFIENLEGMAFSSDNLSNLSFMFVGSKVDWDYCKNRVWLSELISGKRVYDIGYPRFDLVERKKNGNNTVLWLPRWTANIEAQKENEQSSFLRYYLDFLRFAKEHPDVRFIIRPHPLMFENFQKNGIMSESEVESFLRNVAQIKNVLLDTSPDYLDSLNSSSILLADFTSLLAEYYVSGNPIIYTGGFSNYSKRDKKMVDLFYSAGSWDEVEKALEELLSGYDRKEAERKSGVEDFLHGSKQSAGENILKVLLDDYNSQHLH